MKGYIYVSATGTDDHLGTKLNDPILGQPPTLGACMPNIRRLVELGDWIFVVSGSVQGAQQYLVGGFEVDEKINALTAYQRYPGYRLHLGDNGQLEGNIIVDENGMQNPLDHHNKFHERLENYLVGKNPVAVDSPRGIENSRANTLTLLSELFDKQGNRVIDVMGRWRRLDENQIRRIAEWLREMKTDN